MATAEQYAKWCMMIIEGNDEIIDEVYDAMYSDGFVNEEHDWDLEEED